MRIQLSDGVPMFQAVARCSNRESYVLGEITPQEVELASCDDASITGHGLYLIAVDNENPRKPGRVLARFLSEDCARHVADFLRSQGFLER